MIKFLGGGGGGGEGWVFAKKCWPTWLGTSKTVQLKSLKMSRNT